MKKKFLRRLIVSVAAVLALGGGSFLEQSLFSSHDVVKAATTATYPWPYSYVGQTSVTYKAKVVTQVDGLFTPSLSASDQVLTTSSYYGQSGFVDAEWVNGSVTWVRIEFMDENKFWVDKHSLAPEPFSYTGQTFANYQAKVVTQADGLFTPSLTASDQVLTASSYYGQTGTVTAEWVNGSVTWARIAFSDGRSFWIDRHSLQKSYYQESATSYTVDMSDGEYWKDYITSGTNTGARFYTIKAENKSAINGQYYPLFSGEYGDYSHVASLSNTQGGVYFLATKEKQVSAGGFLDTAVYCTPDNVHWYWINKSAFSDDESFSHDGITAHASLKGTGTNGAIKWYVSPTDPLAAQIKAAVAQWNVWLPGTFEASPSSSATNVNINIDEVDLVKTYNSTNYMNYWAMTYMNWDYYLSNGLIVQGSQKVQILLNNGASTSGENNLVAQASNDSQGVTNIIEHEIGHALGLDHSNDYLPTNNLMNSFSNGTRDSMNTLSQQQLNVLKLIRGPLNWTYTGMTNKTATLKAMNPDIGTSQSFSCN
ncbi:hypothetical protein OfM1_18340 [Lactovum odontotermitis]